MKKIALVAEKRKESINISAISVPSGPANPAQTQENQKISS